MTVGVLDFLMEASIGLSEEVVNKTRSFEKMQSETEKCLTQGEKLGNEIWILRVKLMQRVEEAIMRRARKKPQRRKQPVKPVIGRVPLPCGFRQNLRFHEKIGPWSNQGLCLVDRGRGIDLSLEMVVPQDSDAWK